MIEIEDHGAVRTLRLARPPVNALNRELMGRLEAAVLAAPADGARGLVLTGANGRFCAGLDVAELLSLDADGLRGFLGQFFGCLKTLAKSPIPIACAINGHGPAGATVLALFCDRRVMAAGDYRMGLNEVQVGLYPGPTIHAVFARTIGAPAAARLLPAGLLISAAEALAIGLVDELAPPEGVEAAARRWLEGILALPPKAYALTRGLVRADLIRLIDGFGGAELDQAVLEWRSEETRSTLKALIAKLAKR